MQVTLSFSELVVLVLVVASMSACFGLIIGALIAAGGKADVVLSEMYEAESQRRAEQ